MKFLRYPVLTLIFLLTAILNPVWAMPGDIISARLESTMAKSEIDEFISPLFDGYPKPSAIYDVDIWILEVESIYPDGKPARLLVQVFVPLLGAETSNRALYAFGPGSTGLTDACRPSREHVAGIHWGLYRAHVLAHSGQGVIGLIPDYLGFGDPERDQYYMVAEAEASAMLHSIRAAQTFVRLQNYSGIGQIRNFVAGFSQGGHAAFAAADWSGRIAPDVELSGIIGYGPSTDLFALFREFADVAPMALYTFRNLYGMDKVNPNLALLESFASTLDWDVIRQCVGGMQSYYPQDPTKLFKPDFSRALLNDELESHYPGIAWAMKENSTGLQSHGVPALILQGTQDIVVGLDSQRAFVAASREAGNPVELTVLQGVRHDTRQAGFFIAQEWIKSRL